MPLRNRVTPLGELIETPERGLVYGNRGCLHDHARRIRRSYDGRRWIACRLEFRGRRRADPMPPGRYTGLFFLDEATALAAGHRPCAECRHEDYLRYVELVGMRAQAVDARLHEERLGPRRQQALEDLPDGAFVLRDDDPWLVLADRLLRWTPGGYAEARRQPPGHAEVITPPTHLRVLASGWSGGVPLIHPSGNLAALTSRSPG